MQVAARSYLAASVALVGAGAIAISPVAPPLPDVTVSAISSANVELSAAASPFEAYLSLVETSFTNATTLAGQIIENPAPILQQVLANQLSSAQTLGNGLIAAAESIGQSLDPENPYGVPALLEAAVAELAQGNIEGAVNNLWQAFLSPVLGPALSLITSIQTVVRQPVQNLLNVIDHPEAILLPALGVLGPVYSTVTMTGTVAQDVLDSVLAGDPVALANTLIAAPANLANAFLNGEGVPGGTGLLSPGLGTIAAILQARQIIADAIKPAEPAAAQANATLQSASEVVTLDVAPAEKQETTVTGGTASTPAASPETEEAAPAEQEAAPSADAEKSVATNVVKDSPVAVPGKTGTSTKSDRANPVKQVRDDIRSTVKNVTDGFKKAAEGLSGKRGKATSESSSSDSAESSSDAA